MHDGSESGEVSREAAGRQSAVAWRELRLSPSPRREAAPRRRRPSRPTTLYRDHRLPVGHLPSLLDISSIVVDPSVRSEAFTNDKKHDTGP